MTRFLFRFCLVALSAATLLGVHGGAAFAAEKVLGMNVEGDKLSAKDRADLFGVLQSKLERYPEVTLIQPPAGGLIDEMIDLECVDIDTSCLARLGVKYGADKVFYTQVDTVDGGFDLIVRVIDASAATMIRDKKVRAAEQVSLAPLLEEQIEAVLGKPPAPAAPAAPGKLIIRATPDQAHIFIGADFVGVGAVSVERPAGDYTIRVQQDGYEEAVASVTVTSGQTATTELTLKMLSAAGAGPKPGPGHKGVDEDDSDWILWAVIGAVVVGGAITAVAVLSGSDEQVDRGPVIFSIDPNNAWQDASVQGGRP